MQKPPFRRAGRTLVPLPVHSIGVPFTLNVRGATKLPQTTLVTLPITSWHVAPVPRFWDVELGGTDIGLLHSPAQGPLPPPAAPPVPIVPAVPVVPPRPDPPPIPAAPLVPAAPVV